MSPSSGPPRIFDVQRRTARLERSERSLSRADFLHARAAENAVGSLEALVRDWPGAADLSAQPGAFAAALAEFRAAVGKDWVFTSDEDLNTYRDAYSLRWDDPDEYLASAAVAPGAASRSSSAASSASAPARARSSAITSSVRRFRSLRAGRTAR